MLPSAAQKITGKIFSKEPLYGGDINQVTLLVCENGEFVSKTRNPPIANMYKTEAMGLKLLQENTLPVPQVVFLQENLLLMTALKKGFARSKEQTKEAGKFLAVLHRQEQSSFGLEHDNFIGSLPQENTPSENWLSFYRDKRINAQLKLYLKENATDWDIWHKLFAMLPSIINYEVKPSLLHGDLWSGNLFWSADGPVFIDPAVYRGDRYIELAFTELFGGFSSDFYTAYNDVYPIDKKIYENVKPLYQIYPLLVHANLFGGGYYNSAFSIARNYLR